MSFSFSDEREGEEGAFPLGVCVCTHTQINVGFTASLFSDMHFILCIYFIELLWTAVLLY